MRPTFQLSIVSVVPLHSTYLFSTLCVCVVRPLFEWTPACALGFFSDMMDAVFEKNEGTHIPANMCVMGSVVDLLFRLIAVEFRPEMRKHGVMGLNHTPWTLSRLSAKGWRVVSAATTDAMPGDVRGRELDQETATAVKEWFEAWARESNEQRLRCISNIRLRTEIGDDHRSMAETLGHDFEGMEGRQTLHVAVGVIAAKWSIYIPKREVHRCLYVHPSRPCFVARCLKIPVWSHGT